MKKKRANRKDSIQERAEEILQKARPSIQMHGGDVQLIKIKNGIISLKITGACVNCHLADVTYQRILGTLLMEEVPGIKKVMLVQ